MFEEFWNKIFKNEKDCFWFEKPRWCYKFYPTGYEGEKWIKCRGVCKYFATNKITK